MEIRICPTCGRRSKRKTSYCSNACKFYSFRRRVEIDCAGCGIKFQILPYLVKKANYCSVSCYRNSTNKKVTKVCPVCKCNFTVKMYLNEKGQGVHCSQKCFEKGLDCKRKVQKCNFCGILIKKAISVISRCKKTYCSKKCHDNSMRDYVSIICVNCQKVVQIPQSTINRGKGRFCSWYCYTHFKGETSIERLVRIQLQKAHILFEQEAKIGKYHTDFLIMGSKTVIECDGDYWHSIPQAVKKDAVRNLFFKQSGYKVVRFTETEIKRTGGKCVNGVILANL